MPAKEKTRPNSFLVWTVLLLVIVAAVIVIRRFTRDPVPIRTATVSRQSLESSTSTNGKIEPIHEYQAHAAFAGVVKKLYVGVGDIVKPGTLLVTMDDTDIRSRLASSAVSISTAKIGLEATQHNGTQEERLTMAGDLDRANIQKQQAESDLRAMQQLQQKGAASAAEVSAAQQRLQTATSSLAALRARGEKRYSTAELARAKQQVENAQADQASAERSYAAANIRSPIGGTVYSVPIADYDYVPAGEDLLDVADLNDIQVRAYFDEPEIGKLAVGQKVKIVWDAKPNMTWHGHIAQIPTTVTPYGTTRNVGECLITVEDAHGDLLPNTNVIVTVSTSQSKDVLSVPREALHTDGPQNFVYRILGNKLVRTVVQLGVVNLTRVEIISGLSEKDVVALSSTSNIELANGLVVKTVE